MLIVLVSDRELGSRLRSLTVTGYSRLVANLAYSVAGPETPHTEPSMEAKEQEIHIIRQATFEYARSGHGDFWKSSEVGRKMITLHPDSPLPEAGKQYDVEILEDTRPDHPRKGKYVGKIIPESAKGISVDEWKAAEQHVNKAELEERQARAISREKYLDTGKVKSERTAREERQYEEDLDIKTDIDEITKEINALISGADAKLPTIEEKPRDDSSADDTMDELIAEVEDELFGTYETKEDKHRDKAEQLLGQTKSAERKLVELRKKNLRRALRINKKIVGNIESLTSRKHVLLQSARAQETYGEPTLLKSEAIMKFDTAIAQLETQKQRLLESSPEAYYALNILTLKEYKNSLINKQLVETPSVKDTINDVLDHVYAGIPVFIYGHPGGGKSEIAMRGLAKAMGKEPLIISCSKGMTSAEIYGHQVLDINKVSQEDLEKFITTVEERFDKWKSEHEQANTEERQMAHQTILETYLTSLQGGTISDFFLGHYYRAAEEGRLVVFDELPGMNPELRVSLHYLLTRKVGDKINVQQDAGRTIEVQPGFGVVATGNLNLGDDRYTSEDFDPAIISRFYMKEHDYLPNDTKGTLEAALNKGGSELFHIILAMLVDKNINLDLPKGSIEKLWDLAKASRLLQDVYAGRDVGNAYYFKQKGAAAGGNPYYLQKLNPDIRVLEKIMGAWLGDRCAYELDYYIWKEFVSQGDVPADSAYLYQILQEQFGFFKSAGWEQSPDYGSGGDVHTFRVNPPKNKSGEKRFVGPRQVVNYAFGEPKEREKYPDL